MGSSYAKRRGYPEQIDTLYFLRFVEPKSEYYTYFFSAFKKILKNAIQKFIHVSIQFLGIDCA